MVYGHPVEQVSHFCYLGSDVSYLKAVSYTHLDVYKRQQKQCIELNEDYVEK